MKKNQLITPEGTKDYLFEEAALRKNIEETLRGSFGMRGYHEVMTPSLEFLDVFTAQDNSIPTEQMYKLVDSKGRLMVLRPDSTMPIARLCATRLRQEAVPIRLYYNQPVFSVNQSLRGRSDEVIQTGIELIGISNRKSDLEVLVTAAKALRDLPIGDFRIEIGHIGIFNSLIALLDIEDSEKEEIRLLIQSKNYPSLNDKLNGLPDSEAVRTLKKLPRLFGGQDVFEQVETLITDHQILALLTYLKELYQSLQEIGLENHITIDLGIVNRTDYYTGIVFKGYVEGYGEEILSGGRYDSLLPEFGADFGAIGFGINVDSVVRALLYAGHRQRMEIPVLVHSEPEFQIKALEHIDRLTKQGTVSEYSLMDSLEDSVSYARTRGLKQIDIIGEEIKTMML